VVQPIEEELELALYSCGIDMLEAAGFEHYEISNFARPGGRSRHNQVYWANEAYFGFGVGAARYVEGCRSVNTRSLPKYLRQTLVGASATCDCETLPPWERARETMAVQLRRSDGIARQRFLEQTGFHLDDVAGDRIERMVDFGLLEASSRTVRLTRLGRYVADCVIEHLLR
jgi:oxygen-independent coproporphyrinogen-3 oxidase